MILVNDFRSLVHSLLPFFTLALKFIEWTNGKTRKNLIFLEDFRCKTRKKNSKQRKQHHFPRKIRKSIESVSRLWETQQASEWEEKSNCCENQSWIVAWPSSVNGSSWHLFWAMCEQHDAHVRTHTQRGTCRKMNAKKQCAFGGKICVCRKVACGIFSEKLPIESQLELKNNAAQLTDTLFALAELQRQLWTMMTIARCLLEHSLLVFSNNCSS